MSNLEGNRGGLPTTFKSDRDIFARGGLQDWQVQVLTSKIKFKIVVASRQIRQNDYTKGHYLEGGIVTPRH